MTYEEALERYGQEDDGLRAIDPGLQPVRELSTRNDADTGWVFRNEYGFLAYVTNDGHLYSGNQPVTSYDDLVYDGNVTVRECVRGTTSEQ